MDGMTIKGQSTAIVTEKFVGRDAYSISKMVNLHMDHIVNAILAGKTITITSNIADYAEINLPTQIFTANILEK